MDSGSVSALYAYICTGQSDAMQAGIVLGTATSNRVVQHGGSPKRIKSKHREDKRWKTIVGRTIVSTSPTRQAQLSKV